MHKTWAQELPARTQRANMNKAQKLYEEVHGLFSTWRSISAAVNRVLNHCEKLPARRQRKNINKTQKLYDLL